MNKEKRMKKPLKILAVLLVISSFVGILTGCGQGTPPSKLEPASEEDAPIEVVPTPEPVPEDVLFIKEGVDFKKVEVEFVGETLNLRLTMANRSNKDRGINLGNFSLLTADGAELKVNASNKTIDANAAYRNWAFTVENGNKVKVGDTVTVLYDGDSVADVVVGEF